MNMQKKLFSGTLPSVTLAAVGFAVCFQQPCSGGL